MKKISALKCALGVIVVALMVSACAKKDQPSTEHQEKVAEPVVQEIQAICDEPSLRNRLVDALQAGLLDHALMAIQSYDDASKLGLEKQVRQNLTELNIDLHNVVASGATCHADVQFVLPIQQVIYANLAFESLGLAPLDEQAAEAGSALVGGNRLVAKAFAYTIENNKAVIGMDNAIVNLVADAVVAGTHGMAIESHVQAQNTPVVRLEPVAPIATPRIQQPAPAVSEPRPEPQAQHSQPKPKVEKQAKPQDVSVEQTKTQSHPETKPEQPKTEPAKAAQAIQDSPTNENIELLIIESDETY